MKRKEIYIQDEVSSCGACSIQSIVSYYGGYIPLDAVLEDTCTDKSGTNAYHLVETLKKYGFDSYGMKVSIDEMGNIPLPFIAHTVKNGYEHFVVIYEIQDSKIIAMDPEVGKRIYTKEEFSSIATGYIVVAVKQTDIPHYKKKHTLLIYLLSILKRVKGKIILIYITSFVVFILGLVLSFHLKLLDVSSNVVYLTLLFIIIKILANVLNIIRGISISKLEKSIDDESISEFISHIFKLPESYLKNKRVGEIVEKIENMSFIKDLFIRIVIMSSMDLFMLIISTLILFYLSSKLALIQVFSFILYIVITLYNAKPLYKLERDAMRQYDEYSGNLVEYLDGMESIKNLNGEEKFMSNLNSSLRNYTRSRNKKNERILVHTHLINTIMEVSSLIVNLIGYLSLSSGFTIYDMFAIQSIFSMALLSLENITETLSYLIKGHAIERRVSEFIDLESEESTAIIDGKIEKINIENLTFSYDGLHKNIDNFSLTINRGDKILLEGESGIGKSTFVKCIAGKIRSYEGNIYYDEYNAKEISSKSIHDHIIYVGQEEKLFNGTIYENILGDKKCDDLYKEITRITHVDEVIEKRNTKENTQVLEGASNFSGGEKARMFLARALQKNPDVLIIDETLSAVPESMEDAILKNLMDIEDLTLIYITHRKKEKFFNKVIKFRKDGIYDR